MAGYDFFFLVIRAAAGGGKQWMQRDEVGMSAAGRMRSARAVLERWCDLSLLETFYVTVGMVEDYRVLVATGVSI